MRLPISASCFLHPSLLMPILVIFLNLCAFSLLSAIPYLWLIISSKHGCLPHFALPSTICCFISPQSVFWSSNCLHQPSPVQCSALDGWWMINSPSQDLQLGKMFFTPLVRFGFEIYQGRVFFKKREFIFDHLIRHFKQSPFPPFFIFYPQPPPKDLCTSMFAKDSRLLCIGELYDICLLLLLPSSHSKNFDATWHSLRTWWEPCMNVCGSLPHFIRVCNKIQIRLECLPVLFFPSTFCCVCHFPWQSPESKRSEFI